LSYSEDFFTFEKIFLENPPTKDFLAKNYPVNPQLDFTFIGSPNFDFTAELSFGTEEMV
jgi:hypothetical protein